MLSIVMRAFIPGKDFDEAKVAEYKDPNALMLIPLIIFVIVVIIFGLHSAPLVEFFSQVAGL